MKALISFLLTMLVFFTAPVHAADALLGPGDALKIAVFGNADLSLETKIGDAGSITFPLIGEVGLAGLTTADAEKKIAGMLDRGRFVRNPQVSVLVTQMQSQQVSVLGQVNKPGRYPIDGKRGITDVLAMAGGINQDGGDMITLIRYRDGKTIKEVVDLTEMMRAADMAQNIDLSSNDVIYVDRAPRFYIYGEVQRPGTYRLERNMTVLQALSAGGGLTPRGTERGMRIKRRDKDGSLQILEVKHDDVVNNDDIVYVRESLF